MPRVIWGLEEVKTTFEIKGLSLPTSVRGKKNTMEKVNHYFLPHNHYQNLQEGNVILQTGFL